MTLAPARVIVIVVRVNVNMTVQMRVLKRNVAEFAGGRSFAMLFTSSLRENLEAIEDALI